MSNSPFLEATTVIVISGSDVPITTTVIVINFVLTLSASAKTFALSTTKSLASIIPIQQAIVKIIDVIILNCGLLLSKSPCLDLTTDTI